MKRRINHLQTLVLIGLLSLIVGCSEADTDATDTDTDTGVIDSGEAAPLPDQQICGSPDDHLWNFHDILGLEGCTQFRGNLRVGDTGIEDLSELPRLQIVEGSYVFFRNESLRQVRGLEDLTFVGDRMGFSHHPELDDLTALSNLEKVAGEFSMTSNGALTSLDGLESLESVGSLLLSGNDELADLDGLKGLKVVEGDLVIRGNPKLAEQVALDFAAGLEVGGEITIED